MSANKIAYFFAFVSNCLNVFLVFRPRKAVAELWPHPNNFLLSHIYTKNVVSIYTTTSKQPVLHSLRKLSWRFFRLNRRISAAVVGITAWATSCSTTQIGFVNKTCRRRPTGIGGQLSPIHLATVAATAVNNAISAAWHRHLARHNQPPVKLAQLPAVRRTNAR